MEHLFPSNYHFNNTYNHDHMMDTLDEIKSGSFEFLYDLQRTMVSHYRFDYRMTDFKYTPTNLSQVEKYRLDIPKEFITTYNRRDYKNSQFFEKEISHREIASNYDIFSYNFLVFIDGKMHNCFKVRIHEHTTQLVLYIDNSTTGMSSSMFDDYIKRNVDISVFILSNGLFGNYLTNKFLIRKYDGILPIDRFNIIGDEKIDSDETFVFANQCDDTCSKVLVNTTMKCDTVKMSKKFVDNLHSKHTDLITINFKYHYKTIDMKSTDKFFELPIMEHPVPVENMLVFYDDNGSKIFDHNISIKLHYPSIYEVIGNTKDITIVIFYKKPNTDKVMRNELHFYYRFFKDSILDRYKNGTIPDFISDYVPKQYPFSIKDLHETMYPLMPQYYKMNKLQSFIDMEAENLSIYLHRILHTMNRFRIYTKNVDLNSKIRISSGVELPNMPEVIFSEPQYVFTFAKHFSLGSYLKYFVNGLLTEPKYHYQDMNNIYIYFPVTSIDDKSLIEVERDHTCYYERDLVFTSLDTVFDIVYRDNICMANDTLFIDTDTGEYIDICNFEYICTSDGETKAVPPASFFVLGKQFKIKLINQDLIGRNLRFIMRKFSKCYYADIEDESMTNNSAKFLVDIPRNDGYFRVFLNGRLVDPKHYLISHKDNVSDGILLNHNVKTKVGDRVTFEVSSYKYKRSLYMETIPTDGFIDLSKHINKPFDSRWFDIFLNGFKLDTTNFEVISSTKVLIKNVTTNRHLLVLEKDWDVDIFKLDTIYNSVADDILSKDKEIQDIIKGMLEQIIIDDTIEDIANSAIIGDDAIDTVMAEIVSKLFNRDMFLNPDIEYSIDSSLISTDLREYIIENGNVVTIDANTNIDNSDTLEINPDGTLIDMDQANESESFIFPE